MKAILQISLLLISFMASAQPADITWLTQSEKNLLSQIEKDTDQKRIAVLTEELILMADAKLTIPLLEEAKLLYSLGKKKNNPYLESVALSMFGQASRLSGSFVKALQYHVQAMEISRNLSDKTLYAYSVNQSGHIYKDRDENKKAIAIYREASRLADLGNNKLFQFYPIMNLGIVYQNANQPDSSVYFSSRALTLLKTIMVNVSEENRIALEKSVMPYTLANLAGAYSLLKKKRTADSLYSIPRTLIEKYKGDKSRYFYFFYLNISQHYQRNNQVDSSLYAARMAIESVSNAQLEYLSAKPAKILSDFYETRNADSTVKYLKIFLRANEVLNSTQVTQQMQTIAFDEEFHKLEIQQAEKAYRDRLIFYLLLSGLLVVIIAAIYMYRSNRARKKINQELAKQKAQVETTLTNLKSTQSQLIQSEKMASLGELTAGIAHEIQNPLNFVNNFSEVNTELIDELEEEIDKGNLDEAKAITKDIKDNEQKINHHGKRADAIVKGMLQHSRSSSGQKEPTDINALCDEYLRLAYHGLRAKDKSFNATMKTDFDETIGKVNIIPQDIGRVVLNLITNAFYAVDEKSSLANLSETASADEIKYEPTVSVSTKKTNNNIEISVADNGNGISEKILNRIFQPFFTTKPTGQGTGLGLSLSYDIVKAHGGELSVETTEGSGSCFTIKL